MTCRRCKHLDVPSNKAGKRVAYKERAYSCLVEIEMPALPDCVTGFFDFQWPPRRRSVSPDDGSACPCFEAAQ